jgi:vancomycin resistance protein VanW
MALIPPAVRPAWRRRLGRWFYTVKRYGQWYGGDGVFARKRENPLPHVVFEHQTPMLRALKDVDMYLQHNKVTNLRLAAEQIHTLVIQPGETFSFWRTVGAPTASRGFLEGLVLENGRVGKGIGGGLCQMGNLLYWMALHSPLTVTERWRHSYDVFPDSARTMPFGSGATLAWNYIDLQVKNNTNQPFQWCVWQTPTDLHGAIRCLHPLEEVYAVEETAHRIQQEPWGGYSRHNCLLRHTYNRHTGALLETVTVAENHALLMYQPFLPG